MVAGSGARSNLLARLYQHCHRYRLGRPFRLPVASRRLPTASRRRGHPLRLPAASRGLAVALPPSSVLCGAAAASRGLRLRSNPLRRCRRHLAQARGGCMSIISGEHYECPACQLDLNYVSRNSLWDKYLQQKYGMPEAVVQQNRKKMRSHIRGFIFPLAVFNYGSISLISEPYCSAHLAAMRTAKAAGILCSYEPNVRLPSWPFEDAARDYQG